MNRVIFNKKGGVGKSTITCNLAAISASKGKKTLVIDLDTQGNSTHYLLGQQSNTLESTLADFYTNTLNVSLFPKDFSDFIYETGMPNLYVMPSHPDMDNLHAKLESRYKIYKLKEALDTMGEFDNIFIDTPPALNFYTRSALIAANSCIIPFDCDVFSKQALYSLLDTVAEVKADHNPNLAIEGIVVNQFQKRAKLPTQLLEELIDDNLKLFKSMISPSVKIRESHSASQPMIQYAPNHKITEEFKSLYQELKKK
ncbi:MAG: chromosome partitioning protein [Cycloclasticus pugetii]|jgi:chromosome partitioning protein|uniref:Chromatin partitioning ATPase n=1 Tax=Cycloclasticus pugetii TaxID=34068 RepID=A0AB33Z2R4_9GAMM|nr:MULTISPECIES: ParA family protein [Cycloclasticus]ATI02757.1 ParA family protein [Cycloclasticus sp. PY97N]EPD13501.1 chromatin partitioning ATPase [Cycloclasticus pugetii]PHR47494.1 MAG: ParA family protein [Cycloclasticus sp.]SHI52702.1 chromosome partitioning protein [Cycloclasticus pugetii]|tara:strand:+ start:858 stop:1625 length:768 start_codon:yes stop_codon:yes gene_type:complete